MLFSWLFLMRCWKTSREICLDFIKVFLNSHEIAAMKRTLAVDLHGNGIFVGLDWWEYLENSNSATASDFAWSDFDANTNSVHGIISPFPCLATTPTTVIILFTAFAARFSLAFSGHARDWKEAAANRRFDAGVVQCVTHLVCTSRKMCFFRFLCKQVDGLPCGVWNLNFFQTSVILSS